MQRRSRPINWPFRLCVALVGIAVFFVFFAAAVVRWAL